MKMKKILHVSLQMTMDLYCRVTEDTVFDAMKLMEKKCVQRVGFSKKCVVSVQ